MNKTELIGHFEQMYDRMHPLIRHSDRAVAWFTEHLDPSLNIVTRITCEASLVAKTIDELVKKAPLGIFPLFWIYSTNHSDQYAAELKKRGYQSLSTFMTMIWKVKKVNPPLLNIQIVDMNTILPIIGSIFQCSEVVLNGWQDLFNRIPMINILIERDKEQIGVGSLFVDGDVGIISNIAVIPKYQKKGYGTALMLFLMNRAYGLHLKYLILGANSSSEPLYDKLGFQEEFAVEVFGHS